MGSVVNNVLLKLKFYFLYVVTFIWNIAWSNFSPTEFSMALRYEKWSTNILYSIFIYFIVICQRDGAGIICWSLSYNLQYTRNREVKLRSTCMIKFYPTLLKERLNPNLKVFYRPAHGALWDRLITRCVPAGQRTNCH